MRICYVISDIDKSLVFEWLAVELQNVHNLCFILLNGHGTALEHFLTNRSIDVVSISCAGKKDWPKAWYKVVLQLRMWKPQIVHCHLMQATILGLFAAYIVGTRRRIFTRHHGTLHHLNHKKGVLWDKLCNALASDIVAVSENVKNILKNMDHASPNKVSVIPHGFDWNTLRDINNKEESYLKEKYNIFGKSPIIGCIARFTEWKGIQYTIPAFGEFLESYPDALLVLANAQGDYAEQIHKLLKELPSESYRLIAFEPDLVELYSCFDLYVHVPVDAEVEAFGLTYVEALAAEVPSIFTMSGIAPEFIEHAHNAWVVPFRDSKAILAALHTLWQSPSLRSQLKINGWSSVQDPFDLSQMILRLEGLYAG